MRATVYQPDPDFICRVAAEPDDIALLAETDKAHENRNGAATSPVCRKRSKT
jgi:hypothetical protein